MQMQSYSYAYMFYNGMENLQTEVITVKNINSRSAITQPLQLNVKI